MKDDDEDYELVGKYDGSMAGATAEPYQEGWFVWS